MSHRLHVVAPLLGLLLMGAAPPRGAELAPMRLYSPTCTGEYADFLSELLPANAAFEKGPNSHYSYCLRTTATYEHVYYGRGGKLKRSYLKAEAHGTGFAYMQKNGDTYLATNEHVAEYPDVTDDDHPVDGVPAGSRKVREDVRVVANESDDYAPGQIPLTKVLASPSLDIAIFKTHHALEVMPYRFGRSAGLRAGNVVMARGYPLGVFPASNSGKVINPSQPDDDGAWHHTDFVTDALLNEGNSGSPVFAVSCRTGELELVGVYHAHYTGGTGLGLVIGIDQLRSVLQDLKLPSPNAVAAQATAADDKRKGRAALEQASPLYFPFGDQVVRAELEPDGAVRFTLFHDFPLINTVYLSITERQGHRTLQMPSRVSEPVPFAALDAPLREPLDRLGDSLWHAFRQVTDFRALNARAARSQAASQQVDALKTQLQSRDGEKKDLLSTVSFEADDAAWPVIVDTTQRLEAFLGQQADGGFDLDRPDAGVSNAAIPHPAVAKAKAQDGGAPK